MFAYMKYDREHDSLLELDRGHDDESQLDQCPSSNRLPTLHVGTDLPWNCLRSSYDDRGYVKDARHGDLSSVTSELSTIQEQAHFPTVAAAHLTYNIKVRVHQ